MNRKQIKDVAFWTMMGIYFIIVLSFSNTKMKTMRYNSIKIIIADSIKHQFINSNDILNIINKNKINIYGTPIDSVNTLKLEELLNKKNNVIKSIEIYTTYHGNMCIRITQRNPIVRILTFDNQNFYLDEDGYILPYSSKYIARVVVATGNININKNMFTTDFNARNGTYDFPKEKLVHNLFDISYYIYKNKFWKNNIQQIFVKNENQLIFVPQVGNFLINFGSPENIENKFNYLNIMYKSVLPKVGWNIYSEINLSYNNQIVCKKINNL